MLKLAELRLLCQTFWIPSDLEPQSELILALMQYGWSQQATSVSQRGDCRTMIKSSMYVYIYWFQNVVLCCPTPRLHCFLSSHWPSFRFLLFMAFLIPSIQFFFGLPCVLFCFGIHFNAIWSNLPSAILWTWLYNVSWFCSFSFIIGSSNPICN